MISHERSLVEKLENKQFVLLGVNTDLPQHTNIQQKCHDTGVTWRSWADGSNLAITKEYELDIPSGAFPAVFLIDGNGVIREKFIGKAYPTPDLLDSEVEKLLSESEVTPAQ